VRGGGQGRSHPRDALPRALCAGGHAVGARGPLVRHPHRRARPRGHRRHRLRGAFRAAALAAPEGVCGAAGTRVTSLLIRRPDDWHLHLRDETALRAVLPFTATRFARAIVMPTLTPAVTTTELALAYRRRILAALPPGVGFEPLMTLYLTDSTP